MAPKIAPVGFLSCAACGTGEPALAPYGLLKCGVCGVVWYCNATCQRADWKRHKVDCQRGEKVSRTIEEFALSKPRVAEAFALIGPWVESITAELLIAVHSAYRIHDTPSPLLHHDHIASIELQFFPNVKNPRHQFVLLNASLLTHVEGAMMYYSRGGKDPKFLEGITQEGLDKKHGCSTRPKSDILSGLLISRLFAAEDAGTKVDQWSIGLMPVPFPAETGMPMEEDWAEILKKNLNGPVKSWSTLKREAFTRSRSPKRAPSPKKPPTAKVEEKPEVVSEPVPAQKKKKNKKKKSKSKGAEVESGLEKTFEELELD